MLKWFSEDPKRTPPCIMYLSAWKRVSSAFGAFPSIHLTHNPRGGRMAVFVHKRILLVAYLRRMREWKNENEGGSKKGRWHHVKKRFNARLAVVSSSGLSRFVALTDCCCDQGRSEQRYQRFMNGLLPYSMYTIYLPGRPTYSFTSSLILFSSTNATQARAWIDFTGWPVLSRSRRAASKAANISLVEG